MALITTLAEELKAAMKEGNAPKRDMLRFLQSALKNAAIEKHKEVTLLEDSEVEEVLKRLVKQRKDSITQYRAGKREDLALKEEAELKLLSSYLPQALSREETEKIVERVLAPLGKLGPSDMGRIMGAVMKEAGGKADGALVREIVISHLQA